MIPIQDRRFPFPESYRVHTFALTPWAATQILEERDITKRKALIHSIVSGSRPGMHCTRCGISIDELCALTSITPLGPVCHKTKNRLEALMTRPEEITHDSVWDAAAAAGDMMTAAGLRRALTLGFERELAEYHELPVMAPKGGYVEIQLLP